MKLFLFIILFTFKSTFHYAAQDPDSIAVNPARVQYDSTSTVNALQFDPDRIETYKSDKEFSYLEEVKEDSWWTRFKKWLDMKFQQFTDWLFGEYKAHSLVAFFLMILPYIILLLIVGLIVWLFIKLNPGASVMGEQEKPEVFFNEEEEIVHKKDITELIETAIQNGDYRLAIRYYYLQLLKLLNERGVITYEYQKTNSDYLAEVRKEQYKTPLKKIMRLYDFIWYGNFPVTREDFSRVQDSFQQMNSTLKPGENE